MIRSHRESVLRPSLRGRMPIQSRQSQAQAGYSRCSRHDNTHHHANATPRSRPSRLQHVTRRSWPSLLRWNRRPERANPRAERSHRAALEESRALLTGGYQASQGRATIRATRNRQDSPRSSSRQFIRHKLLERYATSTISFTFYDRR